MKLGGVWDAAPELREESGFSAEPEESVTSGRASSASPKSPETLVSKVLFGCPHLFSFLPYLKAESGGDLSSCLPFLGSFSFFHWLIY